MGERKTERVRVRKFREWYTIKRRIKSVEKEGRRVVKLDTGNLIRFDVLDKSKG